MDIDTDPISKSTTAKQEQQIQKDKLIDMLKERIAFYTSETERMETSLKALHCELPISLDARISLGKLVHLQQQYGFKDHTTESIYTSFTMLGENIKNHNKYISKVKLCVKKYTHLNELLEEDLKKYKRESELADKKLTEFCTAEDAQSLEGKIKKYEKEIAKLEVKYPWLQDPALHITRVSTEIENLNKLSIERDKLKTELCAYEGLKTDLPEAKEQLTDIKLEYEKYNNVLANSQH